MKSLLNRKIRITIKILEFVVKMINLRADFNKMMCHKQLISVISNKSFNYQLGNSFISYLGLYLAIYFRQSGKLSIEETALLQRYFKANNNELKSIN